MYDKFKYINMHYIMIYYVYIPVNIVVSVIYISGICIWILVINTSIHVCCTCISSCQRGKQAHWQKNTAVFSVRTSTGSDVVKPILTNQLHLRTYSWVYHITRREKEMTIFQLLPKYSKVGRCSAQQAVSHYGPRAHKTYRNVFRFFGRWPNGQSHL